MAELFDADLSNLELATKLFAPENVDVVKAMRKRHENELDFRLEAANMRECTRDMQKYGVEPSLYVFHVSLMRYAQRMSLPWSTLMDCHYQMPLKRNKIV